MDCLEDTNTPLIVTEGEKKALVAAQHGFACVALSGVNCWLQKPRDANGLVLRNAPSKPITDLNLISWKRRVVLLCFDSDVTTKIEVRRALWSFRCEIDKRGANVRYVKLPAVLGEGKDT
jgi:hypothetical protein